MASNRNTNNVYSWILSVAGTFIIMLLGIIGFFLKEIYSSSIEAKQSSIETKILVEKLNSRLDNLDLDTKNDITLINIKDRQRDSLLSSLDKRVYKLEIKN